MWTRKLVEFSSPFSSDIFFKCFFWLRFEEGNHGDGQPFDGAQVENIQLTRTYVLPFG